MKEYLITSNRTRINDLFLKDSSSIRCSVPVIDYKNTIVKGLPLVEYRWQADFYQKIGVDVVTETVFNYPYPFLTEKTYRPMASLRPFIIVGAWHTLDFLKKIGFKTFSVIIDESYDNIVDPEERFNSVCNSIEGFVSRPLDEIKQDLHRIEHILLYNQTHLFNLVDCELQKFQQAINDSDS
jgi:hypothetical protein